MQRPKDEHILLIGVPDQLLKTCDKILTNNGPLFRGGGLCIFQDNIPKLGILQEVYKSQYNVFAVIEELEDVTAEKSDPFLIEAQMKVWTRSKRLSIV